MGKHNKQRIVHNINSTSVSNPSIQLAPLNSQLSTIIQTPSNNLSKKQRRKIKKQQKQQFNKSNKNKKQKPQKQKKNPNQIQQSINQQEQCQLIQNNQDHPKSQSLIQISSSQNQSNDQQQMSQQIQNINFNNKGKQGFQQLISQAFQNELDNKVKSLSIKRKENINSQVEEVYFYHIKKQIFYKVISSTHQRLNLTHLNETISLRILEENLLFNEDPILFNSSFLVNGKVVEQKIQFMKSVVFKVIKKNTSKSKVQTELKNQNNNNKSKKNKIDQTLNKKQKIKQYISKFIKPQSDQESDNLIQFLRDFQWSQDCLLVSKQNLLFHQTSQPFQQLDSKLLTTNNSLLILGKKNTGKSTLAEYIKNTNPDTVCILDCDIGRSLTISGCVSLLEKNENINLWVGQFTPFNCIKTYIGAIQRLYQIYREKYFSKKLIINTMGYLSGLGELLLYEIYNIINPSEVILVNFEKNQQDGNLLNIIENLRSGAYLKKLVTKSSSFAVENKIRKFDQRKLNINISYLKNPHSQSKGIPSRFQSLLCHKKILRNILNLIQMIQRKQLDSIHLTSLYRQDKHGNVKKLNNSYTQSINMRVVLLGKILQKKSAQTEGIMEQASLQPQTFFFRVFGIGYGFDQKVYFSKQQIQKVVSPNINLYQLKQQFIGMLSQGVDFQKNFYLVNQQNLINFQLQHRKIPYLLPIIKGIGSKGTRNNPAKKI